MKRGPRLLHQLLAGNLLTALPLLIGIGYAMLALEAVGERQQRLLVEGVAASQSGDAIAERLKRLERSVRQMRVLDDPGFKVVAEISYRQLDDLLAEANARLPRALGVPAEPLAALQQQLARVPQLLDTPVTDEELSAYFAEANERTIALRAQIQSTLEARVKDAEAARAATRERLVLLGAAALALTIAAALFASVMVGRPLRHLMGIISRLGVGSWNRPVQLWGPADLVDLGTRLEWLRRQLIAADAQKKAFARDVTHELKTPLAAVIEASSLLDDGVPGPLNPRQREVLKLLRSNTDALRELIEQLLRYNSVRLETDDAQPYPVRELVASAVAPVADLAATKNLRWDIDGDDARCDIDSRRLKLVIGNLLSNGVRYSPPGGRLSLHWQREEQELRFSVTDDGAGIASDEMTEIFKPFYTRGSSGPQRGTGLGLTIVRECVTQLGGAIEVRNADGRGACFEVSLPLSPERRSA